MVPAPLDTVLEVDTPEHLAFRTRLAGPGRRLLAWLVDALLTAALVLALGSVLAASGAAGLGGLGQGLFLLGLFALDWGYHLAWEVLTGGRSAGKLALGLRVVREDGLPVTWRESALRTLLRAADLALFPPLAVAFGPLVMAADPRFRRLGDLVAGTVVVIEGRVRVARAAQVAPDEALLATLPARLPLDRDDLEALELFVHREGVSADRRDELARMVAPVYARRLSLPEPADPAVFLATLHARARAAGRPR